MIAFKPIDIGNFKYKTKKGQKGIVPPHQQRKARKQARKRAAGTQGSPARASSPPEQAQQPGRGAGGRWTEASPRRGSAGEARREAASPPASTGNGRR